jgi:hypothetical protein
VTDTTGERAEGGSALGEEQRGARLLELLLDGRVERAQLVFGLAASANLFFLLDQDPGSDLKRKFDRGQIAAVPNCIINYHPPRQRPSCRRRRIASSTTKKGKP